jgi:diamine N-acetyltransferase
LQACRHRDPSRIEGIVSKVELGLARAGTADLPFIMATERRPGYEALVGHWDAARHQAALADPRHAYFIARDAATPVGFAILRDWAAPERITLIKRVAVAQPDRGVGRALLRGVIGVVVQETDAHRLWLGVFPENARARRTYEALGFQAEGVARGSAFFGGVHRDELVMALLKPEWSAANPKC